MIDKVNLNDESNLLYGFERRHAFDKDKITVGAAMRFMMKNKKTPQKSRGTRQIISIGMVS